MDKWLDQFAAAVFASAAELAHDLKTPLNIAVLNLELLRMRLSKEVTYEERIHEYARAVEIELRRIALIFDAYFTYAVPPKIDEPIEILSLPELLGTLELPPAWNLAVREAEGGVTAHRSRIRDLLKLLISASRKIFSEPSVVVTASTDHQGSGLRFEGQSSGAETDIAKAFKFYYTDTFGTPELAFATARLIAETYGGTVTLWEENGNRLVLELRLPAAARKSES